MQCYLDPRFAYAVPWQPGDLEFCIFGGQGGGVDAESERPHKVHTINCCSYVHYMVTGDTRTKYRFLFA